MKTLYGQNMIKTLAFHNFNKKAIENTQVDMCTSGR